MAKLDPIDIATGEMVVTQNDVELPGLLPLVLSRTHISSYRLGSWFGRSWASTLDQRLEVDGTGVFVTTADGMILVYPVPDGDAGVLPSEGPRWPLTVAPSGGYAVTDPWAGLTWHYSSIVDALGQIPLSAITNRAGHRIDVIREPDGTPVEVAHSGGYRVRVHTADNRVVAFALLDGDAAETELMRFDYDPSGDLAGVVNSSGLAHRYEYDMDGLVVGWVDRLDSHYRYTYDESGRCVAADGSDGCLSGRLRYNSGDRTTTVYDSLGHCTVFGINEHIQVESETDALGNVTRYTWDRYDRRQSVTDPLGQVTRYQHDEHGNVIEVVRPDGTRATMAYNDLHRPVTVVDFDGGVWQREYDDHGNLTAVTDPAGAVARYRYDSRGRLDQMVDPLGSTIDVTTDGAGLITSLTDSTGVLVTYVRRHHLRLRSDRASDPGDLTGCRPGPRPRRPRPGGG